MIVAARIVTTGFAIVLFAVLMVHAGEFFIPLSAKADFNNYCRNTLIKMEIEGGLDNEASARLHNRLSERGFSNISIYGTKSAKQSQELALKVEALYKYNKLTGFMSRTDADVMMVYSMTSVARKITN